MGLPLCHAIDVCAYECCALQRASSDRSRAGSTVDRCNSRADNVVPETDVDAPLSTWCNPTSAVVRAIREGVWVAERPFKWNGIDVGGRMTIIRLHDRGLWIHSPVYLDSMLQASLKKLGRVAHIVV
jgi:hypothetical protein